MVAQHLPALTRRQVAALNRARDFTNLAAAWALLISDGLALWRERGRQRHALASVSDHLLKDIGFSRGEIAREIAKPFWQA